MSRMVGTVSRGIRTPIIRSGDDLVEIVTSSLLEAAKEDGFTLRDRDIVAMKVCDRLRFGKSARTAQCSGGTSGVEMFRSGSAYKYKDMEIVHIPF